MIGETVSRYRVVEELGAGGMGVVYRAHDLELDRDVALKFLPPRLSADAGALARFDREAKLASSLNHPNICTVHDVEQQDGRPFIVMELCTGQTVKQLLKQGPIGLAQAVDLALQLASALDAAHQRGIVHRDIKPANLFVSPAGQVKVLDFGLAKLAAFRDRAAPAVDAARVAEDEQEAAEARAATELTRPGMALGTVAYMSPEQALGQPVDARSDLFSLGAVLYELVSGERAFPGTTPGAVFDRILNREPRRARKIDSRIPVELEVVLDRLLAKSPEHRYPSAAALTADLAHVARVLAAREPRSSASTTASQPPTQPWPAPRRSWLWGAAAVALGLAVLGVALHLTRRPRPLSERDPILLAGFENKTGEPVFDATLAHALAVQLGQSPFLNIVADDRVRETLPLMGRDANERLTPALAREVCQRLGTRAMVRGSISRLGTLYVLLLEATECATGASIAKEQGEAPKAEQVLEALGEMASRLRTRVGESLKSVQAFDVPVAQATTPSLEALKAYTLGVEERRHGGEVEAIPFLERALELDPAFAAAATTLSTVYGNLGEGEKSIDYARLAYAQRDRVSQRERLFIVYQYHDRVTGNLPQAIDTLEVWKRTFTNDFQPPNAIALIQNRLGRYDLGVQEAQQALARTPGHPFAVSQLGHAYRGLGRYDEARRVAEEVVGRGVATVPTRRLVYQLAVLRGDRAAAAQQLEWAKGKPREFDMVAAEAQVLAYRGQLARAAELYARSVGLAESRSLAETGLAYVAHDALTRALYGRHDEALALLRGALARRDGREPTDAVPRVRLLTALGLLGAPEAARMADAFERQLPDSTLVRSVVLPTARGAIALGSGRPEAALEALRGAADYETGAVAVLIPVYLRAEALLRKGEATSALAEYQRIADARGADPFSPVCALAPLGMARALAASGETERAAAAYRAFFGAWSAADPDVPVLVAARAEAAMLAGSKR
jgi:serine/threonine protein kinase/tetratricopeptide (TPR) repeat protein